MTGAITAERIKLMSTRSPYWCIGIVALMSIGIALAIGYAANGSDVDTSIVVALLSGLSRFGVIVLMIMAVLAITSEHRFGTLKTSFLAVPQREKVLIAKAIVYGGLTVVVSLVLTLICLVIGSIAVSSGVDITSDETIRQIWGIPVFALLCVLVGLGVGAIVRQTAGAIVIVLIWMLAVETLLSVLPKIGPTLGPFMPFNNGYRFLDGDTPGGVDFHWNTAGSLIYFAIISIVVFIAGVVVTVRRDA